MTQIQVFQLSVEDLSTMIRQSVATELQKVSNLISKTPKDDSDKILTREEVCKLLKVSTTTLFNWNNDKILENYKVGRRVYYKKSDVLAILNPIKEAS
jgi:excisionase family DNA binding protein